MAPRRRGRLVVLVALLAVLGNYAGAIPAPLFELSVSYAEDRRGPALLDGSWIATGRNVYIYLEVPVEVGTDVISSVDFILDGSHYSTESYYPYDFNRGGVATANAYWSTAFGVGPHTIDCNVNTDNGIEFVTAAFNVAETVPTPPPPVPSETTSSTASPAPSPPSPPGPSSPPSPPPPPSTLPVTTTTTTTTAVPGHATMGPTAFGGAVVEAEEEGGSDESGGVGGLRTFFIVMAVFISSVFAFYVGFLLWTRIHSARERRRFLHAGHRGPTVRTPYAFGPSEAVAAGSGGDAVAMAERDAPSASRSGSEAESAASRSAGSDGGGDGGSGGDGDSGGVGGDDSNVI